MKIEINGNTVNASGAVNFKHADREIRAAVKAKGLLFTDCQVFVQFNERGRFAQKDAGRSQLQAGG